MDKSTHLPQITLHGCKGLCGIVLLYCGVLYCWYARENIMHQGNARWFINPQKPWYANTKAYDVERGRLLSIL